MVKNILIKSPDEWATTKQACRDESVVLIFIPFLHKHIYIYIFLFFCFRFCLLIKKSEQPQIVAFNRIVVNYNIHFLFYLVLTIVRQDTKICNGKTNDFSESCLWIFLLL